MDRPKLEVGDVFRRYGQAYRQQHTGSSSLAQLRVMSAIERCRTAALGGHIEQCDQCPYQRNAYNSCRDRHCPKCQSLARAQWIEDRQAELLDTQYFHVVFTVPEEIAAIAYQNKEVVYSILFRATAETLRTIAADPKHLGAEIGFLAVLHSWGQNLIFHPHLHCVVPGGGLSPDGTCWISCRRGFFLPVRVLSRLFRRWFLESLEMAFADGQLQFFSALEDLKNRQVFLRYLAPVRNRVWWSTPKSPSLDRSKCSITWAAILTAWPSHPTIFAPCPARRLSSHPLLRFPWQPLSKRKIGAVSPTLGHGTSGTNYSPGVPQDYRDRYEALTGSSLWDCPVCHRGHMIVIAVIEPFTRPAFADTS